MEKRSEKRSVRIVLTGPESTGKTEISTYLADKLNAVLIPEYAREYISKLNRKYEYGDVENIAQKQIEEFNDPHDGKIVIFDTWLIITKIWFKLVFDNVPGWLEQKLGELRIDLFLLCEPDIPWEEDSLRENPGKMRNTLYQYYKEEIEKYKFPYIEISGFGIERKNRALKAVQDYLKKCELC